MPDPESHVELPVEDAVEQEQLLAPPPDPEVTSGASGSPGEPLDASLEANEADYAEQQSDVGYDDEDYR